MVEIAPPLLRQAIDRYLVFQHARVCWQVPLIGPDFRSSNKLQERLVSVREFNLRYHFKEKVLSWEGHVGNIRLDIPIDKSPVPAAIDNFYDFLITNIPPGPNDRIAILGTLIEFDITDKSVLYNDFVVRAFADRTVRVSPVPGQAAGDFADRY